jgi:hypothetical protein
LNEWEEIDIKSKNHYYLMKTKFKDMEKYSKNARELARRTQKQENVREVPKTLRPADYVVEGDFVIPEGGAATCVIVFLYDKENKRAAALHIAKYYSLRARKILPGIIEEMRDRGSTDIISLMMGGNAYYGRRDSLTNWRSIRKTLQKYKGLVRPFKHGGLKDANVGAVALWTKDGHVEYAARNKAGKEKYEMGDFYLK